MKKYSTYAFWVALASAMVVFLEDIVKVFGISINTSSVENLILSFCGLLVALGIVNKADSNNDNLVDGSDVINAEDQTDNDVDQDNNDDADNHDDK